MGALGIHGPATEETLLSVDAHLAAIEAAGPGGGGGGTVGGALEVTQLLVKDSVQSIDSKLPTLVTGVPDNETLAQPVRMVGETVWNCSFADTASSLATSDFTQRTIGAGHSVSQGNSNLSIATGTSVNSEFLAKSVPSFKIANIMKYKFTASQRIANQNFMVLLADSVGEGLSCTINSATSISVTKANHGFTAYNIGQFMFVGAIAGASGVPGRYAIASIPDVNTINFTVAGWPASGTCNVDLFGHSHVKNLYNGTTATASLFDTQRRGWSNGDTTTAMLTSAAPGHVFQVHMDGRQVYAANSLVATTTTPNYTMLSTKFENIPDDNLQMYLYLWSYNGTVAPASTTTWTIGFVSVERFANTPVYIAGVRPQGTQAPLPVLGQGTQTVAGSVTSTLAAATVRAGFVAAAGIWWDDSSTVLAANATFTGTSRDLTVTATATAMANAATYVQELRVSAESDQTGTLWLEVSRDNTNWRRVKSVATAAVTGGGFYAEIVHRPSWRYARVGFTNGATLQVRFSIGSIAMAN